MQIKRSIRRTARNLLTAAALAGAALLAVPAPQAHAQVSLSVGIAPPAIPDYEQPLCPGDGYIWTPGYWAWGPDGYYWVDGAWVLPPYEDALWTPGWWGYGDGGYLWYPGYWGRTVGYYGGIDYGFGYFGTGFYGGYWKGGRFWYNRAYGHFGEGFHGNVYNRSYAGFDGHRGGASFNAHPPAEFARGGFHGSGVNGHAGTFHGAESFNRGGNTGVTNRGQQGFANRGQQGFANRGAVDNSNRGGYNGSAAPRNFSQAPRANYGGGAQPRANYGSAQPRANYGGGAPRGNFGGGAHYNAPSGGGAHYSAPAGGGGGGGAHYSAPAGGGGGGGSHGGGGGHAGGGHR